MNVSSAAWRADGNLGDYVTIAEGKGTLFASLFDAHMTPDAAAFCASQCRDVFETAKSVHEGDLRRALEATFEILDRQFLKSKCKATV